MSKQFVVDGKVLIRKRISVLSGCDGCYFQDGNRCNKRNIQNSPSCMSKPRAIEYKRIRFYIFVTK